MAIQARSAFGLAQQLPRRGRNGGEQAQFLGCIFGWHKIQGVKRCVPACQPSLRHHQSRPMENPRTRHQPASLKKASTKPVIMTNCFFITQLASVPTNSTDRTTAKPCSLTNFLYCFVSAARLTAALCRSSEQIVKNKTLRAFVKLSAMWIFQICFMRARGRVVGWIFCGRGRGCGWCRKSARVFSHPLPPAWRRGFARCKSCSRNSARSRTPHTPE